MAVNTDVLHSLGELGFGVAAPRLQDLALATLARAAHAEQAAVRDGCGWLEAAGASDDAIFVPAKRSFCAGLIVYGWRHALSSVLERFAAAVLDCERGLQRALMRRFREEGAAMRRQALEMTWDRRMQRWGEIEASVLVGCVRSAMICTIPEELRVSRFKSPLYGCTAARFCLPRRGRLYGCRQGADEQAHYLVCTRAEVVRAVLLDCSLAGQCMGRLLRGLRVDSILRLRRILLVLDTLLFAFDARRVGSVATARQLVLARLKELRRRHHDIRAIELRAPPLHIADA